MTSIIQNLKDFEELINISKRHGLVELKVGDIHLVLPIPPPEKEAFTTTVDRNRSPDEIDAEIYSTTISM